MRYPKFLINAFATLGVVAFIFLACSVAEDVVNDDTVVIDDEIVIVDDENPPPPIENNYGKYQMTTTYTGGSYIYTTILNTETGDTKLYSYFAAPNTTYTYTYLRGENLGDF